MKSKLLALFAALFVILATTGCMKLDSNLTVNPNDTVSGTATLGFDKSVIDFLKMSSSDTAVLDSTHLFGKSSAITLKPFDDGNYAGTEYTLLNVPLKQFFVAVGGDTKFELTRKNDNLSLTGIIDTSKLPKDLEDAKSDPYVAAMLAASSLNISFTFPGRIVVTNGKQVGNTVTWKGKYGDKIELQALVENPQGVSQLTINIMLSAVALGAAAIGLFFVLRKRRSLFDEFTD